MTQAAKRAGHLDDVMENNDDGENEEGNDDYNDAGKENEDASAENRNA